MYFCTIVIPRFQTLVFCYASSACQHRGLTRVNHRNKSGAYKCNTWHCIHLWILGKKNSDIFHKLLEVICKYNPVIQKWLDAFQVMQKYSAMTSKMTCLILHQVSWYGAWERTAGIRRTQSDEWKHIQYQKNSFIRLTPFKPQSCCFLHITNSNMLSVGSCISLSVFQM